MVPYALCKHGPYCKRLQSYCGYGHSLDSIGLPFGSFTPKLWIDVSHFHKGHAGIDQWYGQRYTVSQENRLLTYIAYENHPFPDWVYMYMWFVDHSRWREHNDLVCVDFNWGATAYLLFSRLGCMSVDVDGADTLELLRIGMPPFDWATDDQGMTFPERLKNRIQSLRQYHVYRAVAEYPVDLVATLRQNTSMHWGPHSRRYLHVSIGDEYLRISESTGIVGNGWWWVASRANSRVCGWVSPYFLVATHEVVPATCFSYVVTEPEDHKSIEVKPPSGIEGMFYCIAPDGTDLSVYPNLCVGFSDASADDRKGIGVAWLCKLPNDTQPLHFPYLTLGMRIIGVEAGEILGVLLNLYVLVS